MRTDRTARSVSSRRRHAKDRTLRLASELLEGRLLLAQTTGLFFHEPEADTGFVFFSPMGTHDSYLMDKDANIVQTWTFDDTPGLLGYLLEDGSVVRAKGDQGGNGAIVAAGAGGIIERVAWDGTPIWSFSYDTTTAPAHLQHHDFEVMPNGNILLIAWEEKTNAEAVAAGRNPATVGAELYPDSIIEVEPFSGNIVWEWHLWDHLVQDFDNTKANWLGGTGVFDHPELVDINYRSTGTGAGALEDWTHANGIDYNAELDQILLSVREFSEYWIIDHSTTTAEAAGHTGGNSGNGGDLLYRWGNPQTYDRGTAGDRVLYYQHDAQWIPDGLPGAGNITVFNNGYGGPANPDVSSVVEITPPLLPDGSYTLGAGQAYGPTTPAWTYTGAADDFAAIISGTQRLPNGNTLIDYGVDATFSEVTPAGEEVWRYVSPYWSGGVLGPEDPIPSLGIPIPGLDALRVNYTFQALHYPPDFASQFPSTVTGRRLFYNNSIWDDPGFGFNNASAIAGDKTAYVPNGSNTSTFANMSSYSKGINGIMVEITSAENTLTAADFTVRMSPQGLAANNTPSTWAAAPAFTVTRVADTPSTGTDRYELVWADGAIANRYVYVVVEGNDALGGNNTNTGLIESDYFFFGNKIGDVGTPEFYPNVNALDQVQVRNNQGSMAPPTGVLNLFDFNRDALVDALDQIIARNNQGAMPWLNLSAPPAAPEPAGAGGADEGDGSSSAVASALAAPSESGEAAPSTGPTSAAAAAAPASDGQPVREFWQQLAAAGDPRASALLASLGEASESLALDEWVDDVLRAKQ
jgi:hypothetical protein